MNCVRASQSLRAGSSAECWCYARITRRREFLLPTPASSSDSRRTSRQQQQRCGLRNGLRAAATSTRINRRRAAEGRYDANRHGMRRSHRQSQETRDGHHGQSKLPHRSSKGRTLEKPHPRLCKLRASRCNLLIFSQLDCHRQANWHDNCKESRQPAMCTASQFAGIVAIPSPARRGKQT